MSVSLTKSKNSTSEHGKQYFFDEKVYRFQNKVYKYFAFLLGGSKSFLLLFVYEHAHLTADYRGRDLASLRHRRMGKANSHGYLLLSVWSGKIDKRLDRLSISFLSRSMFCDESPKIDHNCRSLGLSDVHLDRS